MRLVIRWLTVCLLVILGASGCTAPEPSSTPVRFVDVFGEAEIAGTPNVESAAFEPTEWSFTEDAGGFRAAKDVEAFRVEDGVLRGRSSSNQPIIAARRDSDVPADELLHEVRIRVRASAGTELTVWLSEGEELVLPRALGNPFGTLKTPIRAGDETETYILRANLPFPAEEIQHVLVQPTNAADADFEIESLRLVFRGEHLRSIPSGVAWHGMSEIYRETIVARSPERIRFDVELPAEPWFDVAVATTESSPVTFRVEVTPEGSDEPFASEAVVDVPDRWHELSATLDGLGGRRARVELSIDAGEPGVLGFWGTPAVLSRVAPSERPLGVVLIITDTLRADHLGNNGYERDTAPTLARLGSEGVWFHDVISQATWTKVSVTAIQTSLYPTTHTVGDLPDRLPASATTLAEIYRDAGYRTLALTSIPFVGRMTSLHQGYETLHESGSLPESANKTAAEYVGRLSPWLEKHRETPFFALLHVRDPHSPFRPTPAYETTFAEEGAMDELDAMIEQVRPHIKDPLMRGFGMPTREDLETAGVDADAFVRHETDGMDGSIRGMDDAIADVVAQLETLGLTDRVLVGVVSDHGTELLEHDEHFHGHTVYGELNRVPMLIWGPGYVPASPPVDALVQTIDLMPTLLELSGLPIPERAQGESLVRLINGERSGWNRAAITESPPNLRESTELTSIITDGWKLVRIDAEDGTRYELYSHTDDPINLEDVAADNPEVVERLAEEIERFRQFADAAKLDDDAAATEGMDAEELERLRSLGYVQ